MLVARAQLELAESFIGEFAQHTSEMRSLALLRAQHVAATVTLRSVGHVLQKVDADTPGKRAWLEERWKEWRAKPIFANFIEPGRNVLLKEARGLLAFDDPSVGTPAAVVDPAAPGMVDLRVAFDPGAHRTGGKPTLGLFREAVAFWDVRVATAERTFQSL